MTAPGVRTVPCKFCQGPVMWLKTRKPGVRLPFDSEVVEIDDLPADVDGWIPGRWKPKGAPREITVMAPVKFYSEEVKEQTKRVWTVHTCAASRAHLAARPVFSAQTPRP